jgi:hypothetical protein
LRTAKNQFEALINQAQLRAAAKFFLRHISPKKPEVYKNFFRRIKKVAYGGQKKECSERISFIAQRSEKFATANMAQTFCLSPVLFEARMKGDFCLCLQNFFR